jgi:hypothetical protein
MLRLTAAIFACVFTVPAAAATFVVSNTSDSGVGSLRQAIMEANATSDPDTIEFAIPGDGVHTIAVLSTLPPITKPLIMDGYTQPGSHANTRLPDEGGLDGTLTIEISGASASSGTPAGLIVNNTVATLRGLVVNGFKQQVNVGQPTPNSSNVMIEGCYLGTDPSGTLAGGMDQEYGIAGRTNHGRVIVGGTTAAARNLISGFSVASAMEFEATATGPIIQGNLIGTDASGMHAIATHSNGIGISSGNAMGLGTRIGGDTAAARNVISGNGNGISIYCGSVTTDHACTDGLQIAGNYIGTTVAGTAPLPNVTYGISTSAPYATMSRIRIGGETAESENRIAWNGQGGLFSNDGNATWTIEIARNLIYGNGDFDMDLPYHGRNLNDPGDADETYANRSQNYPAILAVDQVGNQLMITYVVDTAVANASYPLTVRFYRALGLGADLWLGEDTYAVANAQQQKQVVLTLPVGISVYGVIATAADAAGNTSEYSDSFLTDLIFADGFDA